MRFILVPSPGESHSQSWFSDHHASELFPDKQFFADAQSSILNDIKSTLIFLQQFVIESEQHKEFGRKIFKQLQQKRREVQELRGLVSKILDNKDLNDNYTHNTNPKETNNQNAKHQNKHSTKLFVMITSEPSNKNRRNAMRQDLLGRIKETHTDKEVMARFVVVVERQPLGTLESELNDIRSEMREYNDIILVDLQPLQRQSHVLECFSSVLVDYEFEFLLKVTDQSCFNPALALKKLASLQYDEGSNTNYNANSNSNFNSKQNQHNNKKPQYWGYFMNNQGKESTLYFNYEKYPPFASDDCGYLLSFDIVQYLAHPPLKLKSFPDPHAATGVALLPFNISFLHLPAFYPSPIRFCERLLAGLGCVEGPFLVLPNVGMRNLANVYHNITNNMPVCDTHFPEPDCNPNQTRALPPPPPP
eukprot:CAMPEP_0174261398 /NCGR_PEP_ID=MMETSP0439-20130205/11410_1 /TAXON_ID=0 /ORGANISM="Stereomyxa ramosa, Strain Chinc5" /LENGTH=418 /DNA_ID=CAMNT_0015345869 /DNA_START=136 /DNA_END=1392 /DNA_ORIENTATION=+